MAIDGTSDGTYGSTCAHVRSIPQFYDHNDSHNSALQLIMATLPEWYGHEDSIRLFKCTEGKTNILLKIVYHLPGITEHEAESRAVLLRAFGHGTDVIIDRTREIRNHETLMNHELAPRLLAHFQNGMIYRYIPGTVTHPSDLRTRPVSMAIARRLAQWHAVVPCHYSVDARLDSFATHQGTVHKQVPNLWTLMEKWIAAMPAGTKEECHRQLLLRDELTKIIGEFSQRVGLGEGGLVFAHCDLLSGNIIILPGEDELRPVVTFIDYEYATPSPAAFDIANHFAEWVGFDCNYAAIPTRAQRRDFLQEYIRTYFELRAEHTKSAQVNLDEEVEKLFDEVDMYRGIPGFFWGIWACIQAVISDIDFDYASYAESRLGEYWAWRARPDRLSDGKAPDMRLREERWAQP